MKPRAVICDVYRTILDVGPAPADAEARWGALWRQRLGGAARLTLGEFRAATEVAVAREHAAARAVGIVFPEVDWAEILREAAPEVTALDAAGQAEFAFRHAAGEEFERSLTEPQRKMRDAMQKAAEQAQAARAKLAAACGGELDETGSEPVCKQKTK